MLKLNNLFIRCSCNLPILFGLQMYSFRCFIFEIQPMVKFNHNITFFCKCIRVNSETLIVMGVLQWEYPALLTCDVIVSII